MTRFGKIYVGLMSTIAVLVVLVLVFHDPPPQKAKVDTVEAEEAVPTAEEQIDRIVTSAERVSNSIEHLYQWYPEDMTYYDGTLRNIERGIYFIANSARDELTPEQVEITERLASAMEQYRDASILYAKGESGESGMDTDTVRLLEMSMLSQSNVVYDIIEEELKPLL